MKVVKRWWNHSAIYAIFDTFTTRKIKNTYRIRNLNAIDVNNALSLSRNTDWSAIYETNDVNQMMYAYYSKMYKLLDTICPLKTIVSKHKPVP